MGAQIGIVLGSYNDVKRIEPGLKRLQAMEVPFEMTIASAHRTPERLAEWMAGAEERGVRVIIAGAGAAAHLPGVVASKTILPVIGLPFNASPIGGTDALYSIVQMPPGIPVATVGIDSAENAVVLALHILATFDEVIRGKLVEYRAAWKEKIADQNEKLYADYPDAKPASGEKKKVAPSATKRLDKTSKTTAPEVPVRESASCKTVDPEMPSLDLIERAVDVLLKGGVVALPTDTVYGLAVDATNPRAIAKLFRIKGRAAEKAIPVLVDSNRRFRTLTTERCKELDALLDEHWPGGLTVVTRKTAGKIDAVSDNDTVGVRMPDSMVALGVISMLDRPLATTSANLSGELPATSGAEVLSQFGTEVDLILNCGQIESLGVSTVLNVTEKPYRILREGVLSRDLLARTLGERLE